MRYLSLFSGIGAFEKSLERLGIKYELVAFSEIDKYAVKSYCAIHNVDESLNLGDITEIDETALPKDIDLITYGFPCQDISIAGKQKGLFNEDGTQTRSGLFFDAFRIIEATQPRIAIAENVKNLTGKKFKGQFEIVLKSLEVAGYNNYWKVLNAKDFGIPQNRERVFIVSIRKDIDDGNFEFPKGFPLELRLKDIMEDEVDEKFYLSDEYLKRFTESTKSKKYPCGDEYTVLGTTKAQTDRMGTNSRHWVYDTNDSISTLDATMYKQPKQILEPFIVASRGRNPQNPSDRTPGAPTEQRLELNNQGIIDEVKRIVSATRKCDIGVTVHDNGDIRPHRLDKKKLGISEMQINKDTNISNTITAGHMPKIYGESINFRIRKLTPKECFRLMGFEDADFEKAEAVNSNTQLYKQAGNSIVVNVLDALFANIKGLLQ
jgi:DNA (cytosine-5)-methyltransferase 1